MSKTFKKIAVGAGRDVGTRGGLCKVVGGKNLWKP